MVAYLLTAVGRLLLRLRYRIRIKGLDPVAARGACGILFLPNHPALIDPVILATHLYPRFRARALSEKDQIDKPGVRWIANRLRILPLPDPAKYGAECRAEVEQAVRDCAGCLRRGDNLIIYPSGRIYRQRMEDLGGNSAIETILRVAPEVRVVLVRTTGLWGSSFGRASGHAPSLGAALIHGFKTLLASGIFFAPRRIVTIELEEPVDLPRTAPRDKLNRYLEEFYNREAPPSTYVPYTPWERGGTRHVPEPAPSRLAGDLNQVPETTRRLVRDELARLTGRKPGELHDGLLLARDLGLDSLALVDLAIAIEKEFGFRIDDATVLLTVGDALLAACGTVIGAGAVELKPVPEAWFKPAVTDTVTMPAGDTLTDVFLRQAGISPSRVIIADQQGGIRTYRDILVGIFALRPAIQAVPDPYVGIMLPAAGAAAVLTMTALFAGKIPVMINWTVGGRTMAHAMKLLGITRIVTSRRLVQQLKSQVDGLDAIAHAFVYLEDVAQSMPWYLKLGAKFNAWCNWSSLRCVRPPATAVVLFTSGSESLPKAVPLTHANLLANMRDILAKVHFRPDDRLIGILPPFHSFGINCTVLLPLCTGVKVIYHAKPTEGGMLARLIEAYKVTLLVGTPTFLGGVVRAAKDDQVKSLRLVVAGAEKCPDQLYETVATRWPAMHVMEGYGITECSPAVALTDEMISQRGTIGKVLPTISYALVDSETGNRSSPGKSGMLLVRGPSIFGGYLKHDGPSPFIPFEGVEWYRTGDLVSEDVNGVLTFRGRLKRFVKLGGEMISLPAIEEVLNRRYLPPDADAPVLAVESTHQELNPELVVFTTLAMERDEVNRTIREGGLSPLHNIRQIRRIETIPLLGTGKTDYRTLKDVLKVADN